MAIQHSHSYGKGVTTEIRSRRAREGLGLGAVNDVLERIARPSEGDARRAIAALRVGARLASREGLVDWLDRTPYSREVRGEVDLYPDR